MKRHCRRSIAVLLAVFMLTQLCQYTIVWAAEEIVRKIDPTEEITLAVPDKFRDGGNWFFIPESSYTISENSTDKLYIPIQRTGDTDVETEVTLKLIDLSARHDENYTVEIYKEDVEPETVFGGDAIVDLIQNAESIEEVEVGDENDLGDAINEYGGAEIVDGEGNTVGTVSVTPLDENGDPAVQNEPEAEEPEEPALEEEPEEPVLEEGPGEPEEAMPAEEAVIPGDVEETGWFTERNTDKPASSAGALRDARNRYTGTVSDRQKLEGGDLLTGLGTNTMTEDEFDQEMADATQESYPGKEYRLYFSAGEKVKFLVVTPMHSDAAEGDAMIMLMLKKPGEGFEIGEDVNPVSVIIRDEDEPSPVTISMAQSTVYAEDGVAVITVNRSGRINALKGVRVSSWDGSAKQGDEYSGIGAKLYFSMGLTTRSIQIPVYHGTEQKDFYVTITPLSDENITLSTTHVIIPAAKNISGDGELMFDNKTIAQTGRPVSMDPIQVKSGTLSGGSGSCFKSDTQVYLSTHNRVEEWAAYYMWTSMLKGVAYDGIYLDYYGQANNCDVSWRIGRHYPDRFESAMDDRFDDDGWYYGHWLYCAWNAIDPEAAKITSIGVYCENTDATEGFRWQDSWPELYVEDIHYILRQFDVKLEAPEVKPLIGVDDDTVLADYEAVYLDSRDNSRASYWTEDSFSVTAKTNNPLQLVGLDVQIPATGEWKSFASIDGKTSSVVVNLDAETINKLYKMGAIKWSENGNLNGKSYKGDLVFRPVFDYIDVELEIQSDASGYLNLPTGVAYHLGDNLTLSTILTAYGTENEMEPVGVYYELRTQGSTGDLVNWNTVGYVNGSIPFELSGKNSGGKDVDRPHYLLRPVFTSNANNLVVTVTDAEYEKLDTTRGIFADGNHVSISNDNGIYYIVVARKVLINDVYALEAYAKDGSSIARWTTSDNKTYSGETFYHLTNPQPADNVIKLTVPTGQKLTYMTLSGTVASSTFNLNTERSANDIIAAENAYVSYGKTGAWTNEEGEFEMPAVRVCASTLVRFLINYNGVSSIKEAMVPAATSRTYSAVTVDSESVKAVKAKAGLVTVENFSSTGAHFESAFVQQGGKIAGVVDALAMNGNRLLADIKVVGGQYVLKGQILTENIKDVTVYFQDQNTGEIHGYFSSNVTPSKDSPAKWGWVPDGNGGGTFTLDIAQFTPKNPESWTYGDVLMCRLTTDKQTVTTAFTGEKQMVYDPVSTGYAVISDPDFKTQVFDYDIEDVASLLGVEPKTDEDGNLLADDKRASFGSFPYIGAITAAVTVVSRVVSSATASAEMDSLMADLESMGGDDDEDGLDFGDDEIAGGNAGGEGGGYTQSFVFSILVKFEETFYGGVRFMLGVVVSTGGGSGYSSQRNPYHSVGSFKAAYAENQTYNAIQNAYGLASDLDQAYNVSRIGHSAAYGARNLSNFGGPYFKIAVYVGIYIDFGYIDLSMTKDGGVGKSHDAVFMGAGGFIGFTGGVGYTWPFMLGPIPAYVNVEAGMNVTFFLGASADPNKTLAEYEKLDDFKNKSQVHAQDYSFNFEFKGRIYVSGTFGVGWYKILGARITVELVFESGYSNNVTDWFPDLFDTGWGYVTEAGFTGTIDLVITSIDVYSASWPLPLADGFMYYFQEVRRANKCISYVEKGIEDEHGTAADRATALQKCRELGDFVDKYQGDVEAIKDKTYDLKKWAYDHDIITWTTANAIEMNKQGGLVGTVMNAVLQDDEPTGLAYHTNPHVDSKWVANDGQLMAAYGTVVTKDIVENAFAQPSSKIINIGDNKFLMVFLDDSPERDAMQAATLKWTVYDATYDTWTEPQTVQNDMTADSRPNLVDAGNKVIISWASASNARYNALKDEFARKIGSDDPELVQQALEKDPAAAMKIFDIFTVEFNKSRPGLGPIVQLTDDDYYDDFPQAVYDGETGDYIVYYTKTDQNDSKYDSEGEKLLDLAAVSPDPDKTYSAIVYMLYNNQEDAVNTFGQTPGKGWAR
ncbi:MAG: hypothetical protein IKI65_04815, partial [Firmicutes bacterium]|nr:hypothetical protein [Bacillota bacterium]